ncbi:hypothetical protein DPMN_094488 [Dreissena polymorpha]|uniref:Uncharacterized protein n=1 Tax=Dreissena polymorpha TaxID=45954 RepID=A0A9D4R201_DREPO|nr:hypothetical protein DPMN_094488 [Dreissena polymorpha]
MDIGTLVSLEARKTPFYASEGGHILVGPSDSPNLIFGMHVYLMEHILSGERSRSRSSFMFKGFTLHKLAGMRRTGVGKPRPLLDQEKLDLFRVAKKFDRLVADLERKMRAALRCLKEMLKGLD